MSATGRNKEGKERDPFDFYRTPEWCVARLLEADPWIRKAETTLEPCAGDGAILDALGVQYWSPTKRHNTCAWEIQERFRKDLASRLPTANIMIGDALQLAKSTLDLRTGFMKSGLLNQRVRFALAITNPPFGIAFDLLKALWPICQDIVFLLRVSFLGSEERQPFLEKNPPSLRILPNRPQFKWGEADNCEYAWMRWTPHPLSPIIDGAYHSDSDYIPDVRILRPTPLEVRQLHRGPKPANHIRRSKKEARA